MLNQPKELQEQQNWASGPKHIPLNCTLRKACAERYPGHRAVWCDAEFSVRIFLGTLFVTALGPLYEGLRSNPSGVCTSHSFACSDQRVYLTGWVSLFIMSSWELRALCTAHGTAFLFQFIQFLAPSCVSTLVFLWSLSLSSHLVYLAMSYVTLKVKFNLFWNMVMHKIGWNGMKWNTIEQSRVK